MRRLKRVVIREELVALTGNYIQAILLGQFLYWTSRIKDFDSFLDEENRITGRKTDYLKRHGWIYKSAQELKEEIMLPVSLQTIRNHLRELVQKGWLEERKNPNNKWDKTLQYRVNLKKIQHDLLLMGYPLEGWEILGTNLKILKSMSKNRESVSNSLESKLNNLEAIPEITTENTTEITERDINRELPREEKSEPPKEVNLEKREQAGGGKPFDAAKESQPATSANRLPKQLYISPHAKQIVNAFKDQFLTKFGIPPTITTKAVQELEAILSRLSDTEKFAFVQRAAGAIERYLKSEEPFLKKAGYSFQVFVSTMQKYMIEEKKEEKRKSERKDGIIEEMDL